MVFVQPAVVCVVCVGLVCLQASAASDAPASTASDADALAPVLGKKFKLDHCDDMQGYLEAIGLARKTSITIARKCTFEVTLTEEDGEYTETIEAYININGAQRKVLTTKLQFHMGQEVQKRNKRGELVKYTVTQEGSTLTKVWSRGDLFRGTVIAAFSPKEVKSTYKTRGDTYHCVYKPVCFQGDFNCGNNS